MRAPGLRFPFPIPFSLLFASLSLVLSLDACAPVPKPTSHPTTPLYERLGGKPAITAVVDGFVARVAKDQRINRYFWNADVPNLKLMLVDQICELSGGPCRYSGKDMRTAHAGMNIKDSDFQALVENLVSVLNDLRVGKPEQQELLGALGALKPEVVGQ